MHIAICDDEKVFVSHLTKLIDQFASEKELHIKVTVYYDGYELVEKYDTSIDLIFLDIQMTYMDGLKTAGRLRQMDSKVGIIFLTTLPQYALEGYQYQATNYIIKPIQFVRLKHELDNWIEHHRKQDNPFFHISNDTGQYKLFLKNLQYVETFNRKLLFHTEEENIICYKSMKEVEQELQDKGFVRCHTSYIVNLFYVKGVQKLEIKLITGETIPISQPKRKQFMEQLTAYWGDIL